MSTSARDAERHIASLPSTSSSQPCTSASQTEDDYRTSLNIDYLDSIMKNLVQHCAIGDAERMKNLHPIARSAFSNTLRNHEHLRVAFHEPQRFKIFGGRKIPLASPVLNIVVQGTRCTSDGDAIALLSSLLSQMTKITRLSLVMEDIEQSCVQEMINMMLNAENVKLEVLQCTRREGGKPIDQIVDLIKANEETLKIIGRIGVVEAARSFSSKICLKRLSLMTLDLSMDVTSYEIKDELRAVQTSGAQFEHLSYTSFEGFDPTDDRIQDFLEICGVRSLRLTMMQAPQFATRPDGYMHGKVRSINHLEIGEVVDKPAHYNRLVVHEKIYKKVFPNVAHVTFFQNW